MQHARCIRCDRQALKFSDPPPPPDECKRLNISTYDAMAFGKLRIE
jgi:hypothetical protein